MLEIMPHPFLAAGNGQELAVLLATPLDIDAVRGKGTVEGNPMSVPLGIYQHAVAVEKQCPSHDRTLPEAL